MKNPKRIKKLIRFLKSVEDLLEYTNVLDTKFEEGLTYRQILKDLKDFIEEKSREGKVHDIKLFKKFKDKSD